MTGNARFKTGIVPSIPAIGYVSIFVDSVDRHVKQLDEFGGVVDLTKGSGLISESRRIINNVSDMPSIVGGKYLLEAKTIYEVGADFVAAVPIDFSAGNILWTSGNLFGAKVQYFGVEPLFQGVDVDGCLFKDAFIECPNATAFSFSDLASPNGSIVNIKNCNVVANKFADFDTLFGFVIDNVGGFMISDGLSVSGAGWGVQSTSRFAIRTPSPTFVGIDLGSSLCSDINISRLFFIGPPGGIGLSGLPDNGNVAPGGAASIRDSTFVGGISSTGGGIDPSNDVDWDARDNDASIQDTREGALTFLRNNLVVTTITDTNVPVKAAGVFNEKRASHLTTDSTGRITSISNKVLDLTIQSDVVIEPASGNSRSITAYIAKNGIVNVNSGVALVISSNDPKVITLHWEESLALAEYLEVFYVSSSTGDLLGSSVTLTVSL